MGITPNLEALGFDRMLQEWYQYVLVGMLGISVVLATGYSAWLIALAILASIKKRRITVPPADTKEFIQKLSERTMKFHRQLQTLGKPKTFGVYFGTISSPPTQDELRVLTEWEMIIVDPPRSAVLEGLPRLTDRPKYVVGRIDVAELTAGMKETERVKKVEAILDIVIKSMGPINDASSVYNGVVIANWDEAITPGICNEVIGFLKSLNLNVYNEIAAPRFMDPHNSNIDVDQLAGMVFLNGSILPNGDRRDYFDLLPMKRALEIVTAQSCLREFSVLMCELVDDNAKLTNAVVKRSFTWCSYYGAIAWIGQKSALTEASLNISVRSPDGGFDWMKREKVVDIHDTWRLNSKISEQPVFDESVYTALEPILPGISEFVQLYDFDYSAPAEEDVEDIVDARRVDWVSKVATQIKDPISTSSTLGVEFSGLGCFPVGMNATQNDFDLIRQSQIRLLHKGLLQRVEQDQLRKIGQNIRNLAEDVLSTRWFSTPDDLAIVTQLADALTADIKPSAIEVYLGLHTGFRTLDYNSQFWGVFDTDLEHLRTQGRVTFFVSRDSKDLAGTILHTYLSAKRVVRTKCFEAEYALAETLGNINELFPLPARMLQDIDLLTPVEALSLLQCLAIAGSENPLLGKIKQRCEYQLIDVSSSAQLKKLNTVAYLRGDITPEELVTKRIQWYRQNKITQLPRVEHAIELFKTVDRAVDNFLKYRLKARANAFVETLETIIRPGKIDVRSDILALSIFCSMRRFAYEEIYLEASDRCPLFNHYPDQMAVFSEMFGLGSHCEAYLDVTPKALGKVLWDKYRAHYNIRQPPFEVDSRTTLATSYASTGNDIDREGITEAKKGVTFKLRNVSYLGVFAVPALVDILLLTTIGRGLFINATMTQLEQQMSTSAFVLALILSGAVTACIGWGGSYYLNAMVYPTMNMFMVTRWTGGFVLVSMIAIVGIITLGILKGIYAGLIFVLYLGALPFYLFTLGFLSVMHFEGIPLPSGRTAIGQTLLILLISPILATYIDGHDIIIYLSVLWTFCFVFIWRLRQVVSRWNTWLLYIPSNSDQEVLDWYRDTCANGDPTVYDKITAPAALQLARSALFAAVSAERAKPFWAKSTSDENVRKLANAYPATVFLLDWYSRFMQTSKPLPYTSTWNLQINVALGVIRNTDKGLRLHNGFIHWRYASREIACGLLYFTVALIDRWIELVCGGKLIGLAIIQEPGSTISICLGLVYYLFGAVVLEIVTNPLYEAVKSVGLDRIQSVQHLKEIGRKEARRKQKLYWGTLWKFICFNGFGLAFASAFIWVYVDGQKAVILFFAYTFAYSGLLWFQYSKVFAGSSALGPLAIAFVVGVSTGFTLKFTLRELFWSDVIALGAATWTAGFLTFQMASLCGPPSDENETGQKFTHSQKAIGPSNDITAKRLSALFDELERLTQSQKVPVRMPTGVAGEILQILSRAQHSPKAAEIKAAFPYAYSIINRVLTGWERGDIVVEGVSMEHMVGDKYDVHAVSRRVDGRLKIYVGMELARPGDLTSNIYNYQSIAEAIVHETCEAELGLSHAESVLAELLISPHETLTLPRRIERQLENSSRQELYSILQRRDQELVHHLCLNTACDRDWESLPNDVRTLLVKRACGEAYEITESQRNWIESQSSGHRYDVFIERQDLHASIAVLIHNYVEDLFHSPSQRTIPPRRTMTNSLLSEVAAAVARSKDLGGFIGVLLIPILIISRWFGIALKFFLLILIAEPEIQRELDYLMKDEKGRRRWFKVPIMFLLTRFWIYARIIQRVVVPFFMFHGRPRVHELVKFMRNGVVTVMEKERLAIDSIKGRSTAFLEVQRSGVIELHLYSGQHVKKPDNDNLLVSINQYTKSLAIIRRKLFAKGNLVNDFVYEYGTREKSSKLHSTPRHRLPSSRYCVAGDLKGQRIEYSRRGFVKSGTGVRKDIPYQFTYEYRRKARFDDELLRVKCVFTPPSSNPITADVWWCVPPINKPDKLDRWIPWSKVTYARFVLGSNIYETKWTYDHKCHPTLSTTLQGTSSPTPDVIAKDEFDILTKPSSASFIHDDPLLPFGSIEAGFLTRLFGLHRKSTPVSTSSARTVLWKSWKDSTQLDGVTARWLDEMALRSDRTLESYWTARDSGNLSKAIKFLERNGDAIMASVDVDHEVSAWTSLAYKMSDLFCFGQGGDSNINTRTPTNQIKDSHDQLHILATDTGTWPCEGGGVSCCRRDMVNNLDSIKWHIVAEAANDYSIPRFQIERNVQSLKILPLWGLDLLTPTHGIIEDQLDSAIHEHLTKTNARDIREKFLPILTTLVKGSRAIDFYPHHIEECTKALVELNAYFETRNWNAVWDSDIVKVKWRELWLTKDMENTFSIQHWFDVERPTIPHLDAGLELYARYLFIFSLPVPEKIPAVFQATHHQMGAAYGIICKIKRGCTFQVWDHSIIWRETNSYMSSAQCTHPCFVRNSLSGLMRLAAQLNLHHADVILPCTNYFNPGWEIEIGSCEGTLEHRKRFARKIDPVVNGICNMDSFDPIETIRTEKPTVTMLSHVYYIKDIKNALLAADIIVNEWGFKDYRLDVYGGLDKSAGYTVECQEIIASKGLRAYVTLKGYGNPQKVLEDTWVFMNSSISEGLPLAIGEAALTGAPIVCTDVGATFQVLTDPDDPQKRYGTVIAPNDSRGLARAQISMLAVMDEWEEYGEDEMPVGPTPETFTVEDVARITKRMYDKTKQRRNLGLRLRKIVQKSFSGDRYLREHEQMLWLGKYRNEAIRRRTVDQNSDMIVDILDDVISRVGLRGFRPGFLRFSNVSADNSIDSGELRFSGVSSLDVSPSESVTELTTFVEKSRVPSSSQRFEPPKRSNSALSRWRNARNRKHLESGTRPRKIVDLFKANEEQDEV